MTDRDELQSAYPRLRQLLPRIPLAELPTPVRNVTLEHASGPRHVVIKQDNLSSPRYGGNKVRKLEYLLARARARERETIATFGTVGSHHALATAIHARALGFSHIAFLSHQAKTGNIAAALNMHLSIGSELVPFGGRRSERIATLRRWLRGRQASIVPAGGSSWLGTVGFVSAGLEFAAQVGRGECALPDRLYVATGTMGTAVGLALGFALAGVPIELQAVRISHETITSQDKIDRLAHKTAAMLNRLDRSIPADLAGRTRLSLRHGFFADGYARTDAATEHAIDVARRDLNLKLETTYTAKAMAALLADLDDTATEGMTMGFWQSYHAAPLPVAGDTPLDAKKLPEEFLRYFP